MIKPLDNLIDLDLLKPPVKASVGIITSRESIVDNKGLNR